MLFSSPGKINFLLSGLEAFWKLPFTRVAVLSLSELGDVPKAEINNQDNVWL